MKLKNIAICGLTALTVAGCTINVAPGSGQPIDNSQQAFEPMTPAAAPAPQPQPYAPGTNPMPTPVQPATPTNYQDKNHELKHQLKEANEALACSHGFHNSHCPAAAPMIAPAASAPAPVMMSKPPVMAPKPTVMATKPAVTTTAPKKDDKKDEKKPVGSSN